jgi:hypothetical protein
VQDEVKVGNPVIVKVVTTNTTSRNILLWKEHAADQGGYVYRAEVRDNQGSAAHATEFGSLLEHPEGPSPGLAPDVLLHRSGGHFSVKPGEAWTFLIDVSRLYDLGRPGKYFIQLRRFDRGTKSWIKSNRTIVAVTP